MRHGTLCAMCLVPSVPFLNIGLLLFFFSRAANWDHIPFVPMVLISALFWCLFRVGRPSLWLFYLVHAYWTYPHLFVLFALIFPYFNQISKNKVHWWGLLGQTQPQTKEIRMYTERQKVKEYKSNDTMRTNTSTNTLGTNSLGYQLIPCLVTELITPKQTTQQFCWSLFNLSVSRRSTRLPPS